MVEFSFPPAVLAPAEPGGQFDMFLQTISTGIYEKTKAGLCVSSAMKTKYLTTSSMAFLSPYVGLNLTYLGAMRVVSVADFTAETLRFFQLTTEYLNSNYAGKQLSYFVGIVPRTSGWPKMAEEIESAMNCTVLFIVETQEADEGYGSTCLVAGTPWDLPSRCGRPSMKSWADHASETNFQHRSVAVPVISLGVAVYFIKPSPGTVYSLSSLKKRSGIRSSSNHRGAVCEASGWLNRGVDLTFKQQLWTRGAPAHLRGVVERSSWTARNYECAVMDTRETFLEKAATCQQSKAVAAFGAELDITNCDGHSWEFLKLLEANC
nr:uncharacterized protein LOC129382335 [Dermacentor andersoni]